MEAPEWLLQKMFMMLEERSRFRLAMTSQGVLASAEHHVLALVVHGTPLARHHLVRQALTEKGERVSQRRQMVHSSSPLYLARCMDRILHQVAVSGTLCNAAGGTVVNYSGQLRQLCEGPMLEIELRAKMEMISECGEEVAEDVLRIVASWNLEDDQILAWKEDTGMGINDWVGYVDILGCQLTLRNELGSDIVLKFLEPHEAAPRLSSWLEDFFRFPEAMEGPCCGPVFLALGRLGH
mmetsp:Transcript_2587/g.4486  ORF Transcript_2587/g.4486 Transcript_2587/m.4486 type:complete len:238 (-) Transcript_2587:141-854(-)